MSADQQSGQWYWCLHHGRAEPASSPCPPAERMGPYESRAAAEHWRERVEARNEQWDEEDRKWSNDE